MDQNIQQNPNKNGMSLPKTRPRTKQKSIRRFLPYSYSSQTQTWSQRDTS